VLLFVEGMISTAREKLVTVSDDAPLIEAAGLLSSETDIVLVCDGGGRLAGVVTKTDVIRQISRCQGASCTCPVATVMTRDVLSCSGPDGLSDISLRMKDRHLKNIPVVDADNRPLGVLTARAILRVLLGDSQFDEAQLMDYVKGVGYR
jgi:CBS domain-containing protein